MMDELVYIIYFAGIVDSIKRSLVIVFFVVTVLLGFIAIPVSSSYRYDEYIESTLKPFKKYYLIIVFLTGLSLFIPSSKTVYMMASVHMADKAITHVQNSELALQLEKTLLAKLKELESDFNQEKSDE